MKKNFCRAGMGLCLMMFLGGASVSQGAIGSVNPTSPPSLDVLVGSHKLSFDPPETKVFEARKRDGSLPAAPKDYSEDNKAWEPHPGTLSLTPILDEDATLILGSLFRSFQPETLSVSSEDGTAFKRDVDFVYDEDWGRIANKAGSMTGKVKASARAALSRLDLIQVDAAGALSVKKGESVIVCPALPEPDAGCTAVAGIYLAPWRAARNPHFDGNAKALDGATEYAITEHEICAVDPAPPTPTLHPEALSGVLSKLRAGKPVKIAFVGDSITLGAEATLWWNDQYNGGATTWRGKLVQELRTRFPGSKIEPIDAFKGGTAISYALEQLPGVLEQKPDLVIAAFGGNDADGPIGGKPKTAPEDFGKALGSLADASRAAGADVVFVTTFPMNQWMKNGLGARYERDFVPVVKATAGKHNAAVADVHADYKNLNRRGIPHWSQIHNWKNHPGNLGHEVYAETLLRCFPVR